METNTKILKIEEKKAKNGRMYHRIQTSEGWASCFEDDVVKALRSFVGGMCNINIEERGDFKNVTAVLSDGSSEIPTPVSSAPSPEQKQPAQVFDNKLQSVLTSYAKDIFCATNKNGALAGIECVTLIGNMYRDMGKVLDKMNEKV